MMAPKTLQYRIYYSVILIGVIPISLILFRQSGILYLRLRG